MLWRAVVCWPPSSCRVPGVAAAPRVGPPAVQKAARGRRPAARAGAAQRAGRGGARADGAPAAPARVGGGTPTRGRGAETVRQWSVQDVSSYCPLVANLIGDDTSLFVGGCREEAERAAAELQKLHTEFSARVREWRRANVVCVADLSRRGVLEAAVHHHLSERPFYIAPS